MAGISNRPISANQSILNEIALNAYGHGKGLNTGTKGGTGYMGLLDVSGSDDEHAVGRVVKFCTSCKSGKMSGQELEDAKDSSNVLRHLLFDIAQDSDLPEARFKKVCAKLGVSADGNLLKSTSDLLLRKTVASVVTLIDKDIWKRVNAGSLENKKLYGTGGLSADKKSFNDIAAGGGAGGGKTIDSDRYYGAIRDHSLVTRRVNGLRLRAEIPASKDGKTGPVDVSAKTAKLLGDVLHDVAERSVAAPKGQKADFDDWFDEYTDEYGKNLEDCFNLVAHAYGFKGAGKPSDYAKYDALFADLRNAEADDSTNSGVLRKALSAIIFNAMKHKGADFDFKAVSGQVPGKDELLAELGKGRKRHVGNLKNLAADVLHLSPTEAKFFPRAFTSPQQLEDANRVLTVLKQAGGDMAFLGKPQIAPLVHKAVIEARRRQPEGELTERSIYMALTGKWTEKEDGLSKHLVADTIARMDKDIGKGKNARATAAKLATDGLGYDAIVNMVHNPRYVPAARDYYDVPVLRGPAKASVSKPAANTGKKVGARKIAKGAGAVKRDAEENPLVKAGLVKAGFVKELARKLEARVVKSVKH